MTPLPLTDNPIGSVRCPWCLDTFNFIHGGKTIDVPRPELQPNPSDSATWTIVEVAVRWHKSCLYHYQYNRNETSPSQRQIGSDGYWPKPEVAELLYGNPWDEKAA